MAQKPVIHGRDHSPGGSDPIPSLSLTSLAGGIGIGIDGANTTVDLLIDGSSPGFLGSGNSTFNYTTGGLILDLTPDSVIAWVIPYSLESTAPATLFTVGIASGIATIKAFDPATGTEVSNGVTLSVGYLLGLAPS